MRKSFQVWEQHTRFRLLVAVCGLACVIRAPLARAADAPPPKNVLVLYSFSKREVFNSQLLESTVRAHVSGPVNFYIEYLESQRFGSSAYENSISNTLQQTYARQKFDLVIVAVSPALRFALKFRDRIFPGVPIVFMMIVPERLPGRELRPGVTGVTVRGDVRGTLDLTLRLNPDARNVAVVGGTSEFENYWVNVTHRELRLRPEHINEIDLVGLPPEQLLRQVSALPPHTVVIFQLVPQESLQLAIGTDDILELISRKFPTYCLHEVCFGHGTIGGSFPDLNEQVLQAGQLAARVLSGENPEDIPVIHASHVLPEVDWRQARRWGIPESRFPADVIVQYREPTVWKHYEKLISAGSVLIGLQFLLITGLLWQRRRKRKAEAELRESDQRFRVMADTTPSLVWMCDQHGNLTYLNDRWAQFTGGSSEAARADAGTAFIHSDDLPNVLRANSRALGQRERFSVEYRLRRHDGAYRWMLDVAAPRTNDDGSFAGFIGSAADVTDQKLAQEALEKMGGKLIEAQEKERDLIARELHDDICQRLAMLSMELEQVTRGPGGLSDGSLPQIEKVRQHCAEIARDVQSLSHELHSSKLDYLGIVAALKSFCRDISQQHNIAVEFTYEDVAPDIPRNISLCLFRVAQEAVHNAVKYSGVRRCFVCLHGTESQIQLEIRDAGVGFDFHDVMRNGGLGLISMQERMHLVKGTFSVESAAKSGTRIVAVVPLVAAAAAAAVIGA